MIEMFLVLFILVTAWLMLTMIENLVMREQRRRHIVNSLRKELEYKNRHRNDPLP